MSIDIYLLLIHLRISLIASYNFNGDFNDSSGNNHHLTNTGAVLVVLHQ